MTKPRKINVEPLLFLMSFSYGLYGGIYTAFITFKHCLWLLDSSVQAWPNPHDYCLNLGSNPPQGHANSTDFHEQQADLDYLNRVQAATARYMIIYKVVSTVPTVLITIFIGAWSDKHGRKMPIVIALAGSAIATQIAVFTAAVDSIPVYIMLAPAFVKGFTGQMLVISGGTYSMIADSASSSRELTIRIAVASGVSSVGGLLAHLISAAILQHWDGYTVILLCGGLIMFLCFVYAVFGLQETIQFSKQREKLETENGHLVDASAITVPEVSNGSINHAELKREVQGGCKSFLNIERVKESLHILTKARPGRRRFYLLTTLVAFSLLFSMEAHGKK